MLISTAALPTRTYHIIFLNSDHSNPIKISDILQEISSDDKHTMPLGCKNFFVIQTYRYTNKSWGTNPILQCCIFFRSVCSWKGPGFLLSLVAFRNSGEGWMKLKHLQLVQSFPQLCSIALLCLLSVFFSWQVVLLK